MCFHACVKTYNRFRASAKLNISTLHSSLSTLLLKQGKTNEYKTNRTEIFYAYY